MTAPRIAEQVGKAIGHENAQQLAAEIALEVAGFINEQDDQHDAIEARIIAAFRSGLICAGGERVAGWILADLAGTEGRSGAKIAAEAGRSRATYSRATNRARRHLGLPLRQPEKRPKTTGNRKPAPVWVRESKGSQ